MPHLPYYHNCFVCGERNRGKLGVRFEWDGQRVTARWTPTDQHTGYLDVVHGGVLSTLLDETMGWPATLTAEQFTLSVEIKVRFLKPARPGVELIITAELANDNRRLMQARGEIRDAEGNVYATGEGKYVCMEKALSDQCVQYLDHDADTIAPDWMKPAT